jgi:hypothetical protein
MKKFAVSQSYFPLQFNPDLRTSFDTLCPNNKKVFLTLFVSLASQVLRSSSYVMLITALFLVSPHFADAQIRVTGARAPKKQEATRLKIIRSSKGVFLSVSHHGIAKGKRSVGRRNYLYPIAKKRDLARAVSNDRVKPTASFEGITNGQAIAKGDVQFRVIVKDDSELSFLVLAVNRKIYIQKVSGKEFVGTVSLNTGNVPQFEFVLFALDSSFNIVSLSIKVTVSEGTVPPVTTPSPTRQPSLAPTLSPSPAPTLSPSPVPTIQVTATPTVAPSIAPTTTPSPSPQPVPPSSSGLSRLKVSSNGRMFVKADNSPFFWLGDTAWTLFTSLNRADTEFYLETRRRQGINVIQAVVLLFGSNCGNFQNAQGDTPLASFNPFRINTTPGNNPSDAAQYDYWDHVDYVMDLAESKGMYIALIPTWGTVASNNGSCINSSNAYTYTKWVADRYASRRNIIWLIGGDTNDSARTVWLESAKAVLDASSDDPFMTFHPHMDATSSTWFHNQPWLDFNMTQSSHARLNNTNIYGLIESDYRKSPTKPTFDAEPNYEDHRLFDNASIIYTDYDVRKSSYWSVFAGGAGFTYGNHRVWPFCNSGNCQGYSNSSGISWREAITRPGALQVINLKRLVESRDYLVRIPDQSLIASSNPSSGGGHMQAARASDGSYGFVYIPTAGTSIDVDLNKLAGTTINAWWYDPRNGQSNNIGQFPKNGRTRFTTPQNGPDWVLVLDNAARGYGAPGR